MNETLIEYNFGGIVIIIVMLKLTVFNILLIEVVFFIAERIIAKRNQAGGFITTFVLGLFVLYVSFGNTLATLLEKNTQSNNNLNLIDILFFFFNLFYGYWRGLNRIAAINKKYGNL